MLCVKKYSRDYIEICKTKIDHQIRAYKKMVSMMDGEQGAADSNFRASVKEFEINFCSNLVLVLDALFMHRSRILELKDGNPANEVRMLSQSIMTNENILEPDNTIKYKPERAVLRYAIGDRIELDIGAFARLSKAYFEEIVRKFS